MTRQLTTLALALALVSALAAPALADCTRNGVRVPEGTVMGPFKCVDGKWVRTR